MPLTIEGELVAKSTGAASDFSVGDWVFHQKFGNGNVLRQCTAIKGAGDLPVEVRNELRGSSPF